MVAVYVRTTGKAAKVPGWKRTVALLGCETAIVNLEIHYRDPGSNNGGQDADDAPPADPDAPDNTDWTVDGGKHARRMCANHNNAYFCALVAANTPADPDAPDGTDDGDGQDADDAPPADPDAPDNTDWTVDGGALARRMCANHNNAYFCGLVAANEPGGDE